ncbi:tannase, partial [Aureobasidium melanogenum]
LLLLPLPPRAHRLNREDNSLESREGVSPAVNGSLVVDAVEGAVAMPQRTGWPLAKHLSLAFVIARRDSCIQTRRLVAILNPVDHDVHVVLRVRTRLEAVCSAVSSTRDEWTEEAAVSLKVVADHADGHPVNQSIVGNTIKIGEVVEVKKLNKLGHVGSASDSSEPICQESNILSSDGAVLCGSGAGLTALSLTLAEPEAQGRASLSSTVVRFSNEGSQVEMQLAEIGTGDDAICSSIERIASGNGRIHYLGQRTGRRVVVHGMLDSGWIDMMNLLLSKAEGRCTSNSSIVFISETLDLAHALTTAIRAAFVVGVDLGVVHAVEAFCDILADLGHFTQSLVGEHVCCVPVDGSIASEGDLVIAVVKSVVSSGSGTTDSAVLETSSCGTGEGETTYDIETLLEVRWLRESVLDNDLIILASMSIGDGNVAVAVSGSGARACAAHTSHASGSIVDSACSNSGWNQIDAEKGTIGRQSSLNIRYETQEDAGKRRRKILEAALYSVLRTLKKVFIRP